MKIKKIKNYKIGNILLLKKGLLAPTKKGGMKRKFKDFKLNSIFSDKMVGSDNFEPNSEKFHEITYNSEPLITKTKRKCRQGKLLR